MNARDDALMDLYTVAEEAYFAHADTVSTNGIGAAVDAAMPIIRADVEAEVRERIAQEIEARIDDNPYYEPWREAMEFAARIARGGAQ